MVYGLVAFLKKIAQEAIRMLFWRGRERSELGLTGISATRYPDGRRRKNLSAVCLRNAGELLWVFKYALKMSKQRLRHPFSYRELSSSLRSYPQRSDLFFFIFIILSLFYGF